MVMTPLTGTVRLCVVADDDPASVEYISRVVSKAQFTRRSRSWPAVRAIGS
jgi:hypothetical protein